MNNTLALQIDIAWASLFVPSVLSLSHCVLSYCPKESGRLLSLDLNTKSAAILDDCTCGFPKTHHFSGTYSLSLFFLTMGQEVEKKKKGFPCRNNKLFHDQDFHGFAPQSASFLVFTLCVMSNKKETKLDFFLKKTWNVLSVKDDVLLNLTFPMKNSLNEKFAASLNK